MSLSDVPDRDRCVLPDNSARVNNWIESQAVVKTEDPGDDGKIPYRRRIGEQNDIRDDDDIGYDSDEILSQSSSDNSVNIHAFPPTALGTLKEFLIASQALSALRTDFKRWIDSGRGGNRLPIEIANALSNVPRHDIWLSRKQDNSLAKVHLETSRPICLRL